MARPAFFWDPDECVHCLGDLPEGTTDICPWCRKSQSDPTVVEAAEIQAEEHWMQLEIYRAIRRGDLP